MRPITEYSDEELFRIAGIQPSADNTKQPEIAEMSDDELYRIAGIQPKTGLDYQQFKDTMLPKTDVAMPEYAQSPDIEIQPDTRKPVTPPEPSGLINMNWDDWRTGYKEMYGVEPVGTPIDVLKGYGKGLVSGATLGTVSPEISGAAPTLTSLITGKKSPSSYQADQAEQAGKTVGHFVGAIAPISATTKVAGGMMKAAKAFEGLSPVAKGALQTILSAGLYTSAEGAAQQRPPMETIQKIPETAALWLLLYGGVLGLSRMPDLFRKSYNDLVNSDTWRRLTIKERGLVTQNLEKLQQAKPYGEFKGYSEAELARRFPEAKQQAMAARATPETDTGNIRDVSSQFKGPVKDMYNFRLLDYQRKGMPVEQAEAQAFKDVGNTIAGASQTADIVNKAIAQQAVEIPAERRTMPREENLPEQLDMVNQRIASWEQSQPEYGTEQWLSKNVELKRLNSVRQELEGKIGTPSIETVPDEQLAEIAGVELPPTQPSGQGEIMAPAPSGEAVMPVESPKPESLPEPVPVEDIPAEVREPYNPSQLEFIRDRIISAEPPKRAGVGEETKAVGGYPEWFRNKGYTKIQATGAIKKALEGKELTPKQQDMIDDLAQSSLKEYGAIGKQEIYPDQLQEGQKVVIEGEEYTRKGIDAEGNVILKDGETIKQDIFEPLKVDRVLPMEGGMKLTAEAPAAPKTKPVQPDMLGIVEGTMEGKIPAQEAEFPLGQAAEAAKARKVEAEMGKKQGVLGVQKKSPDSLGGIDYQTRTENFKRWFGSSKVVDESGKPKVVYSGHGNIALYGDKFNPTKGTAGGFYGTEDPDIASSYAAGKFGSKEYYEKGSQYRIKGIGGKYSKKLWQYELTPKQLEKLEFLKKEKTEYDEFKHPISEMDRWISDMKNYDKDARRMSYQGSKSLQNIHDFYEYMGNTISRSEGEGSYAETYRPNDFEELLNELGIEWNSFEKPQSGVFPVYLNIKNPIDTSQPFPTDLLKALQEKAKYKRNKVDYDTKWTKDYPLKEWIKEIEEGYEYWSTQIPKEAIPIIRSFGYDGIKDTGGKGGGEKHAVWIAFEPTQIKSAIANKGTYDPNNPSMLYSGLPFPELFKNKSWREFWNPLSTIPESEKYLGLRYKTLGKIDRTEDLVNRIWKKTKGLPDQTKKDMFRFLDGQIEVNQLPPDVRILAKSLRTTNNLIGKMLVKRGMLSEEAFEAHKNQYIRYSYLKHILGDKANVSIGPTGKMNLSYLKSRKDLTDAQKQAIGLIEDISVAEPISVSRPLQDIAKFDMMEAIANNSEWSWQPSIVTVEGKRMGIGKLAEEIDIQKKVVSQAGTPEAQARLDKLQKKMDEAQESTKNMPSDFEQLPTSKSYGPLAGAFIRKEIANDIKPVLSGLSNLRETSRMIDVVIGFAEKSMGAFKIGKVALNLPTLFRNVVSNFIQQNMSGVPFYEIPRNMLSATLAIKNKTAEYTQAKRHGVFKTNWGEAEIGEILKEVRNMQDKSFPGIFASLAKLARYSGKIDDFFKLSKFIAGTRKGLSPEKAAIEAQKWVMDYSRAHPSIKAARRYIAPFVSYQYKVLPLVAESISKRPWVIMKYALIPYAMQEIARRSMNLTEDDWKQLKSRLPFFVRTNQAMAVLPWKSPEGNVQWVNLEYFFPWQNMTQIARDVKEGSYGELVGDFGIGNPMADVYTVAKTMRGDDPPKDPFTGREIYNRLDSPTEKAVKTSEWIYNKWAPGMMTRGGALGYSLKVGEKDRAGRTITPEQAAGRWFGFNIIAPTPEQAFKERKYQAASIKKSLSQILKDPNVATDKKERAVAEYQKRLAEIWE